MFKNFNRILAIIILSSLFFSAVPALAVGLGSQGWGDLESQMDAAGGKGFNTAKPNEKAMAQVVATVIKAFLGMLGIIFICLLVYAGYMWLTAQGDEEKVTKAKQTIQRAVIGLVIVTAAYAITYFVFANLPYGEGTGVQGSPP